MRPQAKATNRLNEGGANQRPCPSLRQAGVARRSGIVSRDGEPPDPRPTGAGYAPEAWRE